MFSRTSAVVKKSAECPQKKSFTEVCTMPASARTIHQRNVIIGSLGLFLAGLYACASIPLAGPGPEADAKSFKVDSTRGRIYIVRPGQRFGHAAGVAFPVVVDGAIVGANGNATFIYVDVPPGVHRVSSQTRENYASVEIDAKAGQLYFVDQRPTSGLLSARVRLTLVDTSSGIRLVSRARMVAGTLTRLSTPSPSSPTPLSGANTS
jgi:Protein of unknown function (DUF2846)